MKRRQLRADQVRITSTIPEIVCCSDRKLRRILQTRIKECALSVHFQVCDKGVPMGDRTPPGPCMEVHSGQSICRRDKCRARNVCPCNNAVRDLLWIEGLAVKDKLCVKFARSPASYDCSDCILRNAKKISKGTDIRRESNDLPDIQVSVCPAVKPVADSSCQRIVYTRMAQSTRDADPFYIAVLIKKPFCTDHSIEPQARLV